MRIGILGSRTGTPEETAKFTEIAMLAVTGTAAAAMVRAADQGCDRAPVHARVHPRTAA